MQRESPTALGAPSRHAALRSRTSCSPQGPHADHDLGCAGAGAPPCGPGRQVGERLGFGITLVLVVEVSKSTMSALLPICGELLWMELFFWINFIATCASLVESCVVLGLA